MNRDTVHKKWGVLLTQVGTPKEAQLPAVKAFLGDFLMDPNVITLPWPLRYLLVKGCIVPLRASRSLHLYRSIFTDEGSPLLISLGSLAAALAKRLPEPSFVVKHALRHGAPSLDEAFASLKSEQVTGVVIVPLFPHTTPATTGSIIAVCRTWLEKNAERCEMRTIAPFYDHPLFINAATERMSGMIGPQGHLLVSYHSLPLAHLKKMSSCDCHRIPQADCKSSTCYHAQCTATTRLIATKLGINEQRLHHAYQSHMGRAGGWLGPFTHAVATGLAESGVSDLTVACPGFLSRCLETMEEIGGRLRHAFLAAGGKTFALVPALDDDALWSDALASIIQANVQQQPRLP